MHSAWRRFRATSPSISASSCMCVSITVLTPDPRPPSLVPFILPPGNEGGGAPGSVSLDVPHGARGSEELGRHGEGAGVNRGG